VALVGAADEELPLTLDAVDYRGLEYQTGVSFSVFALKGRQELARGGRYSAGYPEDGVSEPATGFTLYMDAVLAASETPADRPRLYLPSARRGPRQRRGRARATPWCAPSAPPTTCARGQAPALQPRADRRGCGPVVRLRIPPSAQWGGGSVLR
jgi:ATP phosphoribosyltransferase regulatory subunit